MSARINYLCALIILWLNLVNAEYSETYGNCNFPEGGEGVCVKLQECRELYDIIKNKRPLYEEDKEYLRNRQCGYFHETVCCEPDVASNANFGNNLLPDPSSGMCGIDTSNRIYGGEVTKIDEYPWMVLLRYKKPGNRFGFHCGGVLINNRYVMTASHCVNGRDIPVDWSLHQVRLGEHDTSKNPDCEEDDCAPTPKDILIEDRIPHPNYIPTSRNQRNDIALLRLAETVRFNDFIKPVCLPTASHLRNNDFVGQSMDVAGWGKTESVSASNVKLKVRVNGVSKSTCNSIYSRQNVVIGDEQICAGGEKGKDSCRGDSGGPLVALDNKSPRPYWFCVGLVSFGPSPCGLEGWPGVYTKVSHYISWIQNTVRA
ncbi:serine protease easter-like isoform X2 [Phlebotomus papatasi]|uniref:serine protease easter-like isoform X2 n=1 Tax=Phlebotomus papatasi TaxID=29031 RepID=UPI00248346C3|nr:serine protease easter-like isoform X2 [Phlebotomus papatasi]